jgi:hypothetical protein
MSFEQLTRPFQVPQQWPPAIPAAAGVSITRQNGNGRICWGQAGQMPTPSAGVSFCDNTQTEANRKTEQVTMYANGDPKSGFSITVERALEIDFDDVGTSFNPTTAVTDYVAADLSAFDASMQAAFSEFDGTTTESSCKTAMKLNNGPADA